VVPWLSLFRSTWQPGEAVDQPAAEPRDQPVDNRALGQRPHASSETGKSSLLPERRLPSVWNYKLVEGLLSVMYITDYRCGGSLFFPYVLGR
jgi:hypothetical protein